MRVFEGACTALVTPWSEDLKEVNYDVFKRLIDYQIKNGIAALVFLGTTGEPPTMTENEKEEIAAFAIKYVNRRVKVIIGAGGNNTAKAISDSTKYEKMGADALLHVTPYYNKCTQKGLIKHYTEIANSVKIPIILYNVPGRTNVNILPSTCKELCKIKNIVAIKEASGNFEQISETARLCVNDDFALYSGDDGTVLPLLALGGSGVISVCSNVAPKLMSELCSAYFDGDIIKSRNLQFLVNPLIKLLFCEVNPIPVKKALQFIGFDVSSPRLPLTEMEEEDQEKLLKELKLLDLVKST